MPEIVDVIHKITYEVNDEALQRVQKIIVQQLNDLIQLNARLIEIEKQSARTASSQLAAFERVQRGLETIIGKLNATGTKSEGVLKQIALGVIEGFGGGSTLDKAISTFITRGMQASATAREASVVVTGFGRAAASTASSAIPAALSIGKIVTGLFSFTNIATLALNLLTLFGDELFDTKEDADDFNDALQETVTYSQQLGQEAGSEITKLVTLKAKVEDTTLAYNKRLDAAKQLKQEYPSIFGNLSNEAILAGKVGDAYDRATKSILASARASLATQKIKQLVEELTTLQEDITTEAASSGVVLNVEKQKNGLTKYKLQDKQEQAVNNTLIPRRVVNASDQPNYNIPKKGQIQTDGEKEQEKLAKQVSPRLHTKLIRSNLLVEQINALLSNLLSYAQQMEDSTTHEYSVPDTKAKEQPKFNDDPSPVQKIEPRPMQQMPVEIQAPKVETIDADAMMAQAKKEQEEKDKEAQERRKARVKEMVSEYQNFAEEAVKAINAVLEAQIQALDKEIAARKERVSQAEKLAERGNAEALRYETEQLEKAQAEREKKAKRQMQLNALLQASNQAVALSEAIGAIVAAAAEGDPYTIALRVAAAVAALVAGIASLSSAFSKSNSFADGVVDFKGKGGPRDDANWVRISTGESVITAEGTRKNRKLLEAINKGVELQFTNPSLTYTMPAFAQPQMSTTGYASQYDLRVVENKLDNVVQAIEDNKLKQHIFFNEHGVGIMTERAIRKDRKRWM